MKIRSISYYILIAVFAISLLAGCKKEDQTRLQAGWTSKDPIAIPFNARNNEQKLGNLVVNPSFETGKIYYEESNVKSYDITGWKKVGQNIKWVNSTNGEWSNEDVYKGKNAIKIERKHADETETTGDGIISDFIKVIPGNYSLNLHLKLKNVCPNQSRIGTKMYDAINIRLHYFDKNRLPISSNEHNAFTNKNIDNSFKAFTLSNFWYIDELGWGEIHGKTANYPFFDGDIPDDARYVKIFIGLKGTGEMWIDDVDFRYTEDNFTLLERIKPYFDSSYSAYDKVFPKPQDITKNREIQFFHSNSDIFPVIVIPANANQNIKQVAQLFKQYLSDQIKEFHDSINPAIKIVTTLDTSELNSNQLVFSFGQTNIFHNYKQWLPDSVFFEKKDAYYIYQSQTQNIVFINGSDDDAFKYALNTIIQLFQAKNSIYYSANIIDYPDFLERAYVLHYFNNSLENLNQKLELFEQYKFNNTYFEWYNHNTDAFPFKRFDQLRTGNYSAMIDLVKLSSSDAFNVSNFVNKSAKDIFSNSLNSVLFVGDFYQEYEDCNPDKITFISNKNRNRHLQFDHIELLNDVHQYISEHNLSTKLEFLSPWNRLEIIDKGLGKAEFYYYDLNKNLPDNVSLYWIGETYFTNTIDFADFIRISKLTGNPPILLDNSLLKNKSRLKTAYEKNFYAGKIRVQSIMDAYDLDAFDSFYMRSGQRKILLNIKDLSELNTIRALTAADYYWNTESYNKDRSLWIVLNKLLGHENAVHLVYFNDAYVGLKEICQKMEANGLQFKNVRIAKNFESQLNKYFDLLNKGLTNKELLHELEGLKSELLLKYKELTATVK